MLLTVAAFIEVWTWFYFLISSTHSLWLIIKCGFKLPLVRRSVSDLLLLCCIHHQHVSLFKILSVLEAIITINCWFDFSVFVQHESEVMMKTERWNTMTGQETRDRCNALSKIFDEPPQATYTHTNTTHVTVWSGHTKLRDRCRTGSLLCKTYWFPLIGWSGGAKLWDSSFGKN